MFSACIFCHANLGSNVSIETFPVGRRLAFDAAKGRLWVVCPRCERWNLTPLEERWEAVETCERRYHDSRLRVATDNIGLARVDDGLELVRVGRPLRPEFAAWRYGDQFGRRRLKVALRTGGAVAAGAALLASGPLVGMAAGTVFLVGNLAATAQAVAVARRSSVTLPHPDGGHLHLTLSQLNEVRLLPRPTDEGGWALDVPYAAHLVDGDGWHVRLQRLTNSTTGRVTLAGPAADAAAGRLLPRINRGGASRQRVEDAVRLLEDAGDPSHFFAHAAGRTREWGREQYWGDTGALRFLPQPVRLALEMAAHEDSERAALEGDLAALEHAWRDAEEIAAISDHLLLPASVVRSWQALGGGRWTQR